MARDDRTSSDSKSRSASSNNSATEDFELQRSNSRSEAEKHQERVAETHDEAVVLDRDLTTPNLNYGSQVHLDEQSFGGSVRGGFDVAVESDPPPPAQARIGEQEPLEPLRQGADPAIPLDPAEEPDGLAFTDRDLPGLSRSGGSAVEAPRGLARNDEGQAHIVHSSGSPQRQISVEATDLGPLSRTGAQFGVGGETASPQDAGAVQGEGTQQGSAASQGEGQDGAGVTPDGGGTEPDSAGGDGPIAGAQVGAVTDSNAATNSVSESAANGTAVGVTALATDADATDDVTYSLSDNAGGRFTIDANTGVITVADTSLLDYETATSHQVTVVATSDDGSTSTQSFTINLTDDTSEARVGAVTDSNAAANSVSESAANGTAVGVTALATDADATDDVAYSLSDNAGGRFAIDANTGVGTVADSSLLAYETATSHQVTVVATSDDGSTSTQSVTINRTDDTSEPQVGAVTDSN
ncbi:MAG: cadherin domain-containing protein, partial [Kiloniellales bacterium]|nr:cadherin domain-containing protein [Kiloniellales bacterium]